MKRAVETEIKLRVPSLAAARALLRAHGFKVVVRRVFEQNLLLDDAAGSIRERGMLLRVRRAGKRVTCTFKGVLKRGPHKSREEREFGVSDFEAALALFKGLGYTESMRYEKYRTEFARTGEGGRATLDETPVGIFIELEGPATWIDRRAKAFGFQKADYVTEGYATLYRQHTAD
ncbi:MAG: class IV adenylate cyclase [Acidobacteriota bacterium]|nr:class IV adenylate cyclase [Acidobacteriota bacterium]